MAASRTTSGEDLEQAQPSNGSSTLAQVVAPEDIRRGDFVTLFDEIYEVPSFFWCADTATLPADQLVRLRCIPSCRGTPLRVKQICLPFILAKQPTGEARALDVRTCRLARLHGRYAHAAWKAYKRAAKIARKRPSSIC